MEQAEAEGPTLKVQRSYTGPQRSGVSSTVEKPVGPI